MIATPDGFARASTYRTASDDSDRGRHWQRRTAYSDSAPILPASVFVAKRWLAPAASERWIVAFPIARIERGRMANAIVRPDVRARAHERACRLTDWADLLAEGGRARLHHVAGAG
jgi:hypothetical protein